jgi:hypothetical protein
MNPLRWEVLAVSFVLAVPVLALGLRGEFGLEELIVRLPWCLAAGWGVVALLRWASRPQAGSTRAPGSAEADEEVPAPA